jgi:hypothetical protein
MEILDEIEEEESVPKRRLIHLSYNTLLPINISSIDI